MDYQYGAIENNYLFTGEQYDNNVGFYYLRARFYNPSIGRFHSMDTFPGMQFEPLSLHKYLYTHADPINNIDPSGNFSIQNVLAASAIGGILITYAGSNYQNHLYTHVYKDIRPKIYLNLNSIKTSRFNVAAMKPIILNNVKQYYAAYDVEILEGATKGHDRTVTYKTQGPGGEFGSTWTLFSQVFIDDIIQGSENALGPREELNETKLAMAISLITAHEIGHTFGLKDISSDQYIMKAPYDSFDSIKTLFDTKSFSNVSKAHLDMRFGR